MLKKLLLMSNGEIQVGHLTVKVGKYTFQNSSSYGFGSDFEGSEIVRNTSGFNFSEIDGSGSASNLEVTSQEPRMIVVYRLEKNYYVARLVVNTKSGQTGPICSNMLKEENMFDQNDYGKNVDLIVCSQLIAPNYKVTVGQRKSGNIVWYGYYSGVSGAIQPATIPISTVTLNIGRIEFHTFWGDSVPSAGFTNPTNNQGINELIYFIRHNVHSLNILEITGMDDTFPGSTGFKGELPMFTSNDLNKTVPIYIHSTYTARLLSEKILSKVGLM